jgi:UDP-N-acetylglucosamine 4,6-dehydratase
MKYLILGATGTLGRATIKALLKQPETESIMCLSRDELKQHELKREVNDERVRFAIGDIRDRSSIEHYFDGIDTCFHFAALKRIPEMEAHPMESLKTNVNGTVNAAECAIRAGVKHFVFSSTDKACLPVNTYGACKFLSEQILFNLNGLGKTNFSVYRWGNIWGSRGSVLHSFHDSIKTGKPAFITHENMTRFWLKIEDAVDFVLSTYRTKSNKIKTPQMKAAAVVRVLNAIAEVMGKDAPYKVIGMRPGEKLHEDLVLDAQTGEPLSSDNAAEYTDDELRCLVKEIV